MHISGFRAFRPKKQESINRKSESLPLFFLAITLEVARRALQGQAISHLSHAGLETASMTTMLMISTSIPTNTTGGIRGNTKSAAAARKVCRRGKVVCSASAGAGAPGRREAGAMRRAMFSTAAAMAVALSGGSALAEGTSAELFDKTCAGCHAAGGNIVASGATLFPQDLQRNGVNDADTIYTLIYGGKNKMPGYGQDCQPKGQCTFAARLSDDEVRGLAEYVLEQSKLEWKN